MIDLVCNPIRNDVTFQHLFAGKEQINSASRSS
jgi:hypothetical protein